MNQRRQKTREQKSYKVAYWTKRMERYRIMYGICWKSLVSIQLNPKRQKTDLHYI